MSFSKQWDEHRLTCPKCSNSVLQIAFHGVESALILMCDEWKNNWKIKLMVDTGGDHE